MKFLNKILSTVICLGLCGSVFAYDGVPDSETYANEKKMLANGLLFTNQELIDAFNDGVEIGATHMLVVWDYEFTYQFLVYSFPSDSLKTLINYCNTPGMYQMAFVFAMHLDIDEQLDGSRWHPEYP